MRVPSRVCMWQFLLQEVVCVQGSPECAIAVARQQPVVHETLNLLNSLSVSCTGRWVRGGDVMAYEEPIRDELHDISKMHLYKHTSVCKCSSLNI